MKGDRPSEIISHPSTPEYREAWERIFGKKADDQPNLAAADAFFGIFGYKRVTDEDENICAPEDLS